MAEFSLDFNDVFEGNGKIKDGIYEVFVNNVKEDATPSGSEYVEFDLIIRNDIQGQDFKNSHIFHKVWKTKATGKYNMKTFNTMGKAFRLENGKKYTSFQDLLEDFVNKVALAKVENETSEYNGKTYENTNVRYFNQSNYPKLAHTRKDKDNMNINEMANAGIDISDEDLPF